MQKTMHYYEMVTRRAEESHRIAHSNKSKIDDMTESIDALESALMSAGNGKPSKGLDELMGRIGYSEEKVEEHEQSLRTLAERLKSKEARLTDADRKADENRKEIKEARADISDLADYVGYVEPEEREVEDRTLGDEVEELKKNQKNQDQ